MYNFGLKKKKKKKKKIKEKKRGEWGTKFCEVAKIHKIFKFG
jgi:hypothetical protein